MKSLWAAVAGLILMSTSGCIVREVREIRYVRSDGPPGCGDCEVGAQAASVVADSEPPAPLDEPETAPPGPGYVYTNGYWDWNGDDWTWAPGQWTLPEAGWEYVPPAYYAYGSGCLYVHGHWRRSGHHRPGESMRDHRGELAGTRPYEPGRDHRGEQADSPRPVRDHRGELAGKRAYEPVRDHRGETPTGSVDIDDHTWASSPFVGLPGRVRHPDPVGARPWSPAARTASTTPPSAYRRPAAIIGRPPSSWSPSGRPAWSSYRPAPARSSAAAPGHYAPPIYYRRSRGSQESPAPVRGSPPPAPRPSPPTRATRPVQHAPSPARAGAWRRRHR